MVSGIITARDKLVIATCSKELESRMVSFSDPEKTDKQVRSEFFPKKKDGKYLAGDSRGWKLSDARKNIQKNNHKDIIKPITYRPFDHHFIYYTPDMVDWGREDFMNHLLAGDNIAVIVCRQIVSSGWQHCSITRGLVERCLYFK